MATAERELAVELDQGLHARPGARFVELAAKFASEVTLWNGSRSASAKSILGVLALGVRKGTSVRIRAEGPDAEEAVAALTSLVSRSRVD